MTLVETLQPWSDAELLDFLGQVYAQYHFDFRNYALASIRRRLTHALSVFHCATLAELGNRTLADPSVFSQLLQFLTIQVSDMFRDPDSYRALKDNVLPILGTYPSLKIWVAGCSTGEEVLSLAILLKEVGLLDRAILYATDINGESLRKAQAGVFPLDRMAAFSANYQRAGGRASLSNYYTAAYGAAAFDKSLTARAVFSDHSLATDSVFSEVHLVTCRNVLIYFDRVLQERALGLFRDSLCRRGFLWLGAKESVKFVKAGAAFSEFARVPRIYQKY